jgi:hypothetical protein
MVGVSRGYLFRDSSEWTWEDLRDYVVDSITEVAGPVDFDPKKANAVFRSFHGRHENAVAIARYVFDILHGLWYSTPVGINNFYKGQDPYFAEPITKLLEAAQ